MAKKHSISETTRVQREKIANDALVLLTLDAPEPSADTLKLVDEYVKGNMEINDLLQKNNRKIQGCQYEGPYLYDDYEGGEKI